MKINNKKIIDKIIKRIKKNGWFYLLSIYHITYATILFRSKGHLLEINFPNWSPALQAQMSAYNYQTYIILILIDLIAFGWYYRKRFIIGLALLCVLGLTITLPKFWAYQLIYAGLILILMVKMPKKEDKKDSLNVITPKNNVEEQS
jgi:hypothetical protein